MGLNFFENHFPIDGYFKVFFKQHTSYFKKNIEANCYSIRTALQRKNICDNESWIFVTKHGL